MSTLGLLGGNPIVSLLITLISMSGKKNKNKIVDNNIETKNKNNEAKAPKVNNNNKSNTTKDKINKTKPSENLKDKAIPANFKDKLNKTHNKGFIEKNNHTYSNIAAVKANALRKDDEFKDDDDDDDDDD